MGGPPPVAKALPTSAVPVPPPPPVGFSPLLAAPQADVRPPSPIAGLPTGPWAVPRPAVLPATPVLPAGIGNAPSVGEPPLEGVEPRPPVALNVPFVVAPSKPQSLPREGDRAGRRLAAEEKEHRRLRRNIVTATIGVVVLLLLMAILMKIAG